MKKELKNLIEQVEKKKKYLASIRQMQIASVHRFILYSLSKGQLVESHDIANNLNIDIGITTKHLQTLDEKDIIKFKEGKIKSAYPFATKPTRHEVKIANQNRTFALCAIDALGIPSMMRKDVLVTSSCPYCERSITIEFKGEKITTKPNNSIVWQPTKKIEGKVADDLCPHIDFFCNTKHAGSWQEKVGYEGISLSLEESIEIGKFIFGGFLKE
ncbi:MAG: hypothetical protein E3J54_02850 [Actinobacteria bacterium]|nr:MAG: hypothetical protein E3J54_02850 [Actinomycetota bacterium]